jgi:hypothetical protein
MQVTQFGGLTYDTDDYPFVLLNHMTKEVHGRFSTLEKAHAGRLAHAKNNPDELVLLYNEKTQEFIDWRNEELAEFQRGEYDG